MNKLTTICNGIELQAQINSDDNCIDLCMIDKNGEHNPTFCLNVENGYLTLTVWKDYGDGKRIFNMKIKN